MTGRENAVGRCEEGGKDLWMKKGVFLGYVWVLGFYHSFSSKGEKRGMGLSKTVVFVRKVISIWTIYTRKRGSHLSELIESLSVQFPCLASRRRNVSALLILVSCPPVSPILYM